MPSAADLQSAITGKFWVACAGAGGPLRCPEGDTTIYFRNDGPNAKSVACGHIDLHGQTFIPNAAYQFTFEIPPTPTGPDRSYLGHAWNDHEDRVFTVSWAESADDVFLVLVDTMAQERNPRTVFKLKLPTTY